ncbi:hypothetical protein FHS59_003159 [Algoriphagus iocasae]|jgi:hypothetical protein|uniref:Uncharacterized protein n=1 Tax=Algoriphagus iocasae TaxID=1836499 RepID=A0A841MTT2_9BACT|nr:hypothetical protein [Algoriphagus iocasae]MBB6327516.1 hypothetical protein [Algoriphagus iocasae]
MIKIKTKILVFTLMVSSFMVFLKTNQVKGSGGDKACVYTVDTPDSMRVDCFGEGSMCSMILACPKPKFGNT